MYGAILGDTIGSPYEFDMSDKTKDFPLFSAYSKFTDDTIMTIAVAEAVMDLHHEAHGYKAQLIASMKKYGHLFPDAGYGSRFRWWLFGNDVKPYRSYGNGSAMRVSSVAWLYNDLQTVRKVARFIAEVTHNHPEGIKGAEATASAIFLARTGSSKAEIKAYTEENFGYNQNRTCDEIRPGYHHVETSISFQRQV